MALVETPTDSRAFNGIPEPQQHFKEAKMSRRTAAKRRTAPTAGASKTTPSPQKSGGCVISTSYELGDNGNCRVVTVLSDAKESEIKRVFVTTIPPQVLLRKAMIHLIKEAVAESQRLGYTQWHIGYFHPNGDGHTFSVGV